MVGLAEFEAKVYIISTGITCKSNMFVEEAENDVGGCSY